VILPDAKGKYEIRRIARQGSPQPLVTPPEADAYTPIWSPDGESLVYVRVSRLEGDGIYLMSLNDQEHPRLLLRRGDDVSFRPGSWSPDGSRLLVTRRAQGRPDIVEISVQDALTAEGAIEPRALVSENALDPRLSPDGRWLLFTSNDSGRDEVYVAPYREDGTVGPRQPVSQGRAGDGRWGPDGKTVFFNDQRGHILSVTLDPGRAPLGEPTMAADLDELRVFPWFDVLPDGRLVFVQKAEREHRLDRVDLILGFGAELERRIP
jgi:serine/threonine-protein kinase